MRDPRERSDKKATDGEEAIALANATEYGLAGYVFTRSTSMAFRVSDALDVGMVGVNNLLIAAAEVPFGGVKHSGFGRATLLPQRRFTTG